MPGADDLRGPSQGCGHHLVVDHDQPQVVASRALLDQDIGMLLTGPGQCRIEFVGICRRPTVMPLPCSPRVRLDHNVAHLVEERVVLLVEGGQPPSGDDDSGIGDNATGQSFCRRIGSSLPRMCTPTRTLG